MYFPIRTLRTSGIPKCRIASRTVFPCGSSTAAFGMTITLAFITAQYCGDLRRQAQSPHLLQNGDVKTAIPPENIHPYISFFVSREEEINACVSHFHVTNADLRKELRQEWLRKY